MEFKDLHAPPQESASISRAMNSRRRERRSSVRVQPASRGMAPLVAGHSPLDRCDSCAADGVSRRWGRRCCLTSVLEEMKSSGRRAHLVIAQAGPAISYTRGSAPPPVRQRAVLVPARFPHASGPRSFMRAHKHSVFKILTIRSA
jgi:hypothetical protein